VDNFTLLSAYRISRFKIRMTENLEIMDHSLIGISQNPTAG
jgi:hypothetical protein